MSVPRSKYMPDHLSDGQAMDGLKAYIYGQRVSTAHLLGHIAVVDERQLYRPAGYDSMFAFCVGELHLCEGGAYRRITAARLARELPILFEAVADGRLHLAGIAAMSKHLSKSNVLELVAAATHKTRKEIEALIAERFPQEEPATMIRAIPQRTNVAMTEELAPGRVPVTLTEQSQRTVEPGVASAQAVSAAPAPSPRPVVKPIAPQRFALQLTMDQSTHDKLRRAQELLSHAIPSGDLAQVLDRALDALIEKLEKRKLGKTSTPRAARRGPSEHSRHIPTHVQRAVHARDGSQCTFVSDSGHRCASRRVEYDHIEPFARGGASTADNIRLRCCAHNQYEAEQVFGSGFMHQKREAARAQKESRPPTSA